MAQPTPWLTSFLDEHGRGQEYYAERLSLVIHREIRARMEAEGITQRTLAERLGVTPAYVSRLLGRRQNVTLRSLAIIADALNAEWAPIQLVPRARAAAEAGQKPYRRTGAKDSIDGFLAADGE